MRAACFGLGQLRGDGCDRPSEGKETESQRPLGECWRTGDQDAAGWDSPPCSFLNAFFSFLFPQWCSVSAAWLTSETGPAGLRGVSNGMQQCNPLCNRAVCSTALCSPLCSCASLETFGLPHGWQPQESSGNTARVNPFFSESLSEDVQIFNALR